MHIPARYYKRIPKFYFVAGILLVLTAFNMDDNPLGAYLYFLAGVVSVVYAVSVFQARRKRRQRAHDDLRPAPVEETPAAEKRPPLVNDNQPQGDHPDTAYAAEAQDDNPSGSDTGDGELAQESSGVTASPQVESKS
ncbi:MAG: hypothetical protein R3192_11970 [Woeseiaceae bacterium]|nr:hypothetical protein [Woeseiaceae bacterium]